MKRYIILCVLSTTLSFSIAHCTNQIAVISTPVADLIGEPLNKSHTPNSYNTIPVCAGSQNTLTICPRIHQALFNEIVTIIDETDTEYCIEITNTYFVTEKNGSPHTRYWTLKKNCYLLDNESIQHKKIPAPITFKKPTSMINKNILTLIKPWHERSTRKTFSVGTRFIYIPEKSDKKTYTITFFDAHHNKLVTRSISKDKCIHTQDIKNTEAQRHIMINLIREWIITTHNSHIPYVWGGCSYTHHYPGPYKEIHKKYHKNIYSFYDYPQQKKTACHTGFDCAGLILRATQCVGIPFFCKNSYTMQKKLTPLYHYSDIKPGDILWIPGHVMILADLDRNTIIEARGYPHGYGKLHEIPIQEQFKDINTIKDIVLNQHQGKPLYRLNKQGTVVGTIPCYKILKLF